jgi:phage tail-like protein
MPPKMRGEDLFTNDIFKIALPGSVTVGHFSRCSGLELTFEVLEYAEGGNNDYSHKLPGRLMHPNLVLSRGLTDSDALLKWFGQTKTKAERGDITLTVESGGMKRTFAFHDAFPVRWTGPSFDANGAAVFGTETLEIAHSGLVLPT